MKFWLRLGVSAAALGLLVKILPWPELRAGVLAMDWTVWIVVVGLFLAGHVAGSFKWRLMVNVGRAGLAPVASIRCYGAGLFANLCLPSIVGGDVVRAAIATKMTRRAEAVVWGSIADRLIDVFALGVLIAGGMLVNRATIPGVGSGTIIGVVTAGLVGFLLTVAWAGRRPVAAWPRRVRRVVGRSLVALRRMKRVPAVTAVALSIALGMQAGFVLLNAWIGHSIGIDVPLALWFFVWPLAKLAGLIPISLNGLGVRDATQGALLSAVGVSAVLGVVASLVWQSVLVAGGLLAGAASWAVGRYWRSGTMMSAPHLTSEAS